MWPLFQNTLFSKTTAFKPAHRHKIDTDRSTGADAREMKSNRLAIVSKPTNQPTTTDDLIFAFKCHNSPKHQTIVHTRTCTVTIIYTTHKRDISKLRHLPTAGSSVRENV